MVWMSWLYEQNMWRGTPVQTGPVIPRAPAGIERLRFVAADDIDSEASRHFTSSKTKPLVSLCSFLSLDASKPRTVDEREPRELDVDLATEKWRPKLHPSSFALASRQSLSSFSSAAFNSLGITAIYCAPPLPVFYLHPTPTSQFSLLLLLLLISLVLLLLLLFLVFLL